MKRTCRILILGLSLRATPSPQTQASVRLDMITGNRRNFGAVGFREKDHNRTQATSKQSKQNNHPDPGCLLLGAHDMDKNKVHVLHYYILQA